jgi:hypothetical protein
VDPQLDKVEIPFVNTGHQPAKDVEVTYYTETFATKPGAILGRVDGHWTRLPKVDEFPVSTAGLTGADMHIGSPATAEELRDGSRAIIVAGTIEYNEGFPDTGTQTTWFCAHSLWTAPTKTFGFIPCDARDKIAMIKRDIQYPNNYKSSLQ